MLDDVDALTFIIAAIGGFATRGRDRQPCSNLHPVDRDVKAGFGAFFISNVDASFSLDGDGACAGQNNLIIIAIGLGIGAMFVRSMTIFLVRKGDERISLSRIWRSPRSSRWRSSCTSTPSRISRGHHRTDRRRPDRAGLRPRCAPIADDAATERLFVKPADGMCVSRAMAPVLAA